MSSIASLGRMVSGLQAAQKGLQVTGHNLSNVNTPGYIRQQLLQHDSFYIGIGRNGSGQLLQVGNGVTQTEIRQIRDELADRRFRTQNSVLNFYQTQNACVQDIESILDEPYGQGLSVMLENFWSQTQKLAKNPGEVEERLSFIQSANVLVQRANLITDNIQVAQDNLNKEVKKAATRINEIIKGVYECNEKIAMAEINGDHANDYRDQRNVLLDELSGYMDIDYYEEADSRIVLKAEGKTVVNKMFVTTLELKNIEYGNGTNTYYSPFVEPVWSDTKDKVYKLDQAITTGSGRGVGKLKALLVNRGIDYVRKPEYGVNPAYPSTPPAAPVPQYIETKPGTAWEYIALNDNYSVDNQGNSFLLPKIAKELNDFINELVAVCNGCLDGMGTGISERAVGVPLFVPIKTPPGCNPPAPVALSENPTAADIAAYNTYVDKYKAYLKEIQGYMVPGNIQVNPALLEDGGYNKLGTVDPESNDVSNNNKVNAFLTEWNKNRGWPKGAASSSAPHAKQVNLMSFYSEFVTKIGMDGSLYKQQVQNQQTAVTNIENERQAMGGVSQDEEFTYMLKYQYAYNASARVITMMDSMMDTIINRM